MDILAIQEAIDTLENSDTTVDNVQELAYLYIVMDHLKQVEINAVEREYNDIMPAYKTYIKDKTKYQLGDVSETLIIKDFKNVCEEIKEFLHILYSGTDMRKERKLLIEMIEDIHKNYSQK